MKIKIITDSGCDIPLSYKLNNTEILNFDITIDDKSYEERVDFSFNEFYDLLRTSESIPKTAHITVIRYGDKYLEMMQAGVTDLIVVTINKSGSATFNAAVMAKKMFEEEYPDSNMNITVLDSSCYSIGYGWPIIQADEMIDNNTSADEVINFLNATFEKTNILLGTYNLKYMKKSGRISAAAAFAGELMGFRPVIKMKNDTTEVLQKVRGDKNLIPALINQLKNSSADLNNYIIAYTNESYGKELYDACEKEIGIAPKAKFQLGCVVTANSGPDCVAIVFLG